jgi:hypothetical protein
MTGRALCLLPRPVGRGEGWGSTSVELRNDRQRAVPSPSPRRTGRGLGRGESIGVGTILLSPALSSLDGRRGRSRRVLRGNFLNSMAVGLGRGVSLGLARPSSPRPSPPLAGGEGEAAASCAGTSLIQRQCSPALSSKGGEGNGVAASEYRDACEVQRPRGHQSPSLPALPISLPLRQMDALRRGLLPLSLAH